MRSSIQIHQLCVYEVIILGLYIQFSQNTAFTGIWYKVLVSSFLNGTYVKPLLGRSLDVLEMTKWNAIALQQKYTFLNTLKTMRSSRI